MQALIAGSPHSLEIPSGLLLAIGPEESSSGRRLSGARCRRFSGDGENVEIVDLLLQEAPHALHLKVVGRGKLFAGLAVDLAYWIGQFGAPSAGNQILKRRSRFDQDGEFSSFPVRPIRSLYVRDFGAVFRKHLEPIVYGGSKPRIRLPVASRLIYSGSGCDRSGPVLLSRIDDLAGSGDRDRGNTRVLPARPLGGRAKCDGWRVTRLADWPLTFARNAGEPFEEESCNSRE